jgi:hypothetical protein
VKKKKEFKGQQTVNFVTQAVNDVPCMETDIFSLQQACVILWLQLLRESLSVYEGYYRRYRVVM